MEGQLKVEGGGGYCGSSAHEGGASSADEVLPTRRYGGKFAFGRSDNILSLPPPP